MAYSDATATVALFPGLPQTTTTSGYSTTVLLFQDQQPRADAFVDSFCARRYTIPFASTSTSTPPLIKQLAQEVCAYYGYRSLFMKDNINKSDWVESLWEEAKKTLEAIRDGKQDVVSSSGSVIAEINASTKIDSNFETYSPIFNMDPETSHAVDQDRLDDIESDRV